MTIMKNLKKNKKKIIIVLIILGLIYLISYYGESKKNASASQCASYSTKQMDVCINAGCAFEYKPEMTDLSEYGTIGRGLDWLACIQNGFFGQADPMAQGCTRTPTNPKFVALDLNQANILCGDGFEAHITGTKICGKEFFTCYKLNPNDPEDKQKIDEKNSMICKAYQAPFGSLFDSLAKDSKLSCDLKMYIIIIGVAMFVMIGFGLAFG